MPGICMPRGSSAFPRRPEHRALALHEEASIAATFVVEGCLAADHQRVDVVAVAADDGFTWWCRTCSSTCFRTVNPWFRSCSPWLVVKATSSASQAFDERRDLVLEPPPRRLGRPPHAYWKQRPRVVGADLELLRPQHPDLHLADLALGGGLSDLLVGARRAPRTQLPLNTCVLLRSCTPADVSSREVFRDARLHRDVAGSFADVPEAPDSV